MFKALGDAISSALNSKRKKATEGVYAEFNSELYEYPYMVNSWKNFTAAQFNFFDDQQAHDAQEPDRQCIDKCARVTKLKWWNIDTFKNYKKCGNKKYSEQDIIYTVDSTYFRRYNRWGGKKKVACFGCSNTAGIGLPDRETWVYQLNDLLGIEEYTCRNYGMCGASADTISRFVSMYLNNNTPDIIVCLFPDVFRFEYISSRKKRHTNYSPCISPLQSWYVPEYAYIKAMTNEYFVLNNFIKNLKFIEALCLNKNIKFIWHTWSDLVLNLDPSLVESILGTNCLFDGNKLLDPYSKIDLWKDTARDGKHYGVLYNTMIAQGFAKKLQSQ